jgi:hypothetical protein
MRMLCPSVCPDDRMCHLNNYSTFRHNFLVLVYILGIFLFTTASRTALGPTQTPIQWVTGALSLVVKRLGREADHSPPSSAEVK